MPRLLFSYCVGAGEKSSLGTRLVVAEAGGDVRVVDVDG